jgi:hypothetical protein
MFKAVLSLALASVVTLCLVAEPAYAESKADKQVRLVEKIKAGVNQLGTGEQARIEVNLTDKTKLKGYISEATDDHFVVVDSKTGAATHVTYGQVRQVKGNNLSTGAKIAIGLGILAGVLAFLLILENTG